MQSVKNTTGRKVDSIFVKSRIPVCTKWKNGTLKSRAFSTDSKEAKIAGEAQERWLILMLITAEPSEVRTQQSTGISTLSSAHIICFHRQRDWELKRLRYRTPSETVN